MQFFTSQLESISSQIESLQAQLEEFKNQKTQLESDRSEFNSMFSKLSSLVANYQDNPELRESLRTQFESILGSDSTEPKSEPQSQPEPKPQPEPEPENSVCLYRNPSVFWDSHADSMRMFLYTNADAIATGEKIIKLRLATRYEVNPIDSESFCLTLSGVQLRPTADRILEVWLEDEVEDMADQEMELAEIEPEKSFQTHHSTRESSDSHAPDAEGVSGLHPGFKIPDVPRNVTSGERITLKLETQDEAELFGRHAVDRQIIESYTVFSDGQVQIFGMLDEQEFNKYKIEFDLASEDPIELEFCDRQAAEHFSQDLIEKNLATEFEIDDEGKLKIINPKEPEEILRLLEIEPNSKSWLNDQAYYRNDCLVMGFKTKKLRNEWAKFFDIPLGGNASIEPMDSSLISGLKCSLKITFYSGIEKSLERIQEFDFTLTPRENEIHIKQKSEEIGVQFSHEPIDTNVWMLYAKRPFEEKIQLAGALLLNGKYRVPNLYNRDFETLDLAAEALWLNRKTS